MFLDIANTDAAIRRQFIEYAANSNCKGEVFCQGGTPLGRFTPSPASLFNSVNISIPSPELEARKVYFIAESSIAITYESGIAVAVSGVAEKVIYRP